MEGRCKRAFTIDLIRRLVTCSLSLSRTVWLILAMTPVSVSGTSTEYAFHRSSVSEEKAPPAKLSTSLLPASGESTEKEPVAPIADTRVARAGRKPAGWTLSRRVVLCVAIAVIVCLGILHYMHHKKLALPKEYRQLCKKIRSESTEKIIIRDQDSTIVASGFVEQRLAAIWRVIDVSTTDNLQLPLPAMVIQEILMYGMPDYTVYTMAIQQYTLRYTISMPTNGSQTMTIFPELGDKWTAHLLKYKQLVYTIDSRGARLTRKNPFPSRYLYYTVPEGMPEPWELYQSHAAVVLAIHILPYLLACAGYIYLLHAKRQKLLYPKGYLETLKASLHRPRSILAAGKQTLILLAAGGIVHQIVVGLMSVPGPFPWEVEADKLFINSLSTPPRSWPAMYQWITYAFASATGLTCLHWIQKILEASTCLLSLYVLVYFLPVYIRGAYTRAAPSVVFFCHVMGSYLVCRNLLRALCFSENSARNGFTAWQGGMTYGPALWGCAQIAFYMQDIGDYIQEQLISSE